MTTMTMTINDNNLGQTQRELKMGVRVKKTSETIKNWERITHLVINLIYTWRIFFYNFFSLLFCFFLYLYTNSSHFQMNFLSFFFRLHYKTHTFNYYTYFCWKNKQKSFSFVSTFYFKLKRNYFIPHLFVCCRFFSFTFY